MIFRTFRLLSLILLSCLIIFPDAAIAQSADPDFWSHWGDGQAEVSSFRVSSPRYGESRSGNDVLIFVTEDFGVKSQVKVDRAMPSGQKVAVLKLNHVRKFVTGIYDYALMNSVFIPLANWKLGGKQFQAGFPIKVSYSSTEWCGNYYQQLNSRPNGLELETHSYFDGEADSTQTLVLPEASGGGESLSEDSLLIRVRELQAELPEGKYKLLTSLMYSRLARASVSWQAAEVRHISNHTHGPNTKVFEIVLPGRTHTIVVGDTYPRPILGWTVAYSDGKLEQAELLTRLRTAYWDKKSLTDEGLRKKLKLVEQ
jgi:hypothetical protein